MTIWHKVLDGEKYKYKPGQLGQPDIYLGSLVTYLASHEQDIWIQVTRSNDIIDQFVRQKTTNAVLVPTNKEYQKLPLFIKKTNSVHHKDNVKQEICLLGYNGNYPRGKFILVLLETAKTNRNSLRYLKNEFIVKLWQSLNILKKYS